MVRHGLRLSSSTLSSLPKGSAECPHHLFEPEPSFDTETSGPKGRTKCRAEGLKQSRRELLTQLKSPKDSSPLCYPPSATLLQKKGIFTLTFLRLSKNPDFGICPYGRNRQVEFQQVTPIWAPTTSRHSLI